MRPSGIESVRAVQTALAEVIAPELASAFAQDTARTAQMLLESLAGDWDTAAENLRRDNETLARLLAAARKAIIAAPDRNGRLASIVTEIEGLSRREDNEDSVALSRLTARNRSLMAALEHTLVAFEDLTGEAGYEAVEPVRKQIYAHLKSVAARGWSFWDLSSFRGRMAAIQSASGGDDARGLVE